MFYLLECIFETIYLISNPKTDLCNVIGRAVQCNHNNGQHCFLFSRCDCELMFCFVFFAQEAITDGLEIAVSPRSLHSELMCPICLDMLKNTMTTKECLHRFCAECIITALRSG